jgi:hypothetical protein
LRYAGHLPGIISELAMSRLTIAILVAMAVSGPAMSAERAVPSHGWHRTAARLPAGLPRPHYHFRTTISYGPPYNYPRPYPGISVYDEQLFTPVYADVPYALPLVAAPVLPDSSALPGYYGTSYIYDYHSPYYGGPYVGYWDRLPYGCRVYGYC